MDQTELIATLKRVTNALQQAKLTYHLTGGLVSSYYGEPRLTQDIDIVVAIDVDEADVLADALEPCFFVDRNAFAEAVSQQGLFQALDKETFIKIDFHVQGNIRDELLRSVSVELFEGITAPIASKCDAILSKLIWIREGSGKSRGDVLGMLKDPEPYDENLLDTLATEHQVKEILSELKNEIDPT